MPWSNQSGGGGGWKNNGSGGPWGQGPQRGGGGGMGGGNSPDLEEILRKSQDRLKSAMPPGAGNNAFLIPVIFIALIAFWGYQSFYVVDPDELGVELLFGEPKDDVVTPGLNFHIWPIESYEIVKTAENSVLIGGGPRGRSGADSGLMLSGDQNIVDITFTVLWAINDPRLFLFNVADPESMIRNVAESAMRDVVARRSAEGIFRTERDAVAVEVKGLVQSTLDSYGAGVIINQVAFQDASPPAEVADAFDEVQRAQQDEQRQIEEANRYRNRVLGDARGAAAKIREEGAAYKDRVVQEATGEAARFNSIFAEYEKAKDVTRARLYLETMEKVLRSSNKVIIEGESGQGVVPYLPLPEVDRRVRGATQ